MRKRLTALWMPRLAVLAAPFLVACSSEVASTSPLPDASPSIFRIGESSLVKASSEVGCGVVAVGSDGVTTISSIKRNALPTKLSSRSRSSSKTGATRLKVQPTIELGFSKGARTTV